MQKLERLGRAWDEAIFNVLPLMIVIVPLPNCTWPHVHVFLVNIYIIMYINIAFSTCISLHYNLLCM